MSRSQSQSLQNYISPLSHDNSMGLVRYILALGVMIAHFNFIFDKNIPWAISSYDCVGGFFALSGFVLVSSLLKGISWKKFLVKRAWRILPSYFFIVIFFAIALSAVSALGAGEYFASSGFWAYLGANLSFLNFLHPTLPGVFQGGFEAVNGSLWTMKIEWQLYISAPIVVWLCSRYKIGFIKCLIAIIILSTLYRVGFAMLYDSSGSQIYEILGRQLFGQLVFFYAGILLYCKLPFVRENLKGLTVGMLAAYILFTFFIPSSFYYFYLETLVVSGLVVVLSLLPYNISRYIDGGHNVSYEIYLAHFPVIQLVNLLNQQHPLGTSACFALVAAGTVLMAALTYSTVGRLYKHVRI